MPRCSHVPTYKFKSGHFHKNVATHMGEVKLRFTFQVASVQLWEVRRGTISYLCRMLAERRSAGYENRLDGDMAN